MTASYVAEAGFEAMLQGDAHVVTEVRNTPGAAMSHVVSQKTLPSKGANKPSGTGEVE